MKTHQMAFNKALNNGVTIEGHTDLALDGLKFSGNAQKRTKNALVFHGTFLLNLEIKLLDLSLKMPSLEPKYRKGRSHHNFCRNIPISDSSTKKLIKKTSEAQDIANPVDDKKIEELTITKYTQKKWIYR